MNGLKGDLLQTHNAVCCVFLPLVIYAKHQKGAITYWHSAIVITSPAETYT